MKETQNIQYIKGFTLLELLLVLSLIGIMLAIAAPNIQTLYRGFQNSMIQQDIEKQLNHISFKVYLNGQDFELTKESAQNVITLPEDVEISLDNPIFYRFNGICKGGTLQIETNSKKWHYLLEAPFCFPQLQETHEKS